MVNVFDSQIVVDDDVMEYEAAAPKPWSSGSAVTLEQPTKNFSVIHDVERPSSILTITEPQKANLAEPVESII